MFTKEKLEKQIKVLDSAIKSIKNHLCYDVEEVKCLVDLKHTLEQIHTTMTSDNSI